MKTYAINLLREPNKREHILNECAKYNLNVEIINAVDGKELSEDYLKDNVYNYPNCKLTKGEIGCALSHIHIYEKMVNDNIPLALILEDDALFMSDPIPLLTEITKYTSKVSNNVYLLSGCLGRYFINKKLYIGNYIFYKADESFLTHGYVITLNAAKKLLKLQSPLKFEADKWYSFELFGCVTTYCLLPLLIDNNDKTKENSTLEQDRDDSLRYKERHEQMRKIYNSNLLIFCKRKLLKWQRLFCKIETRKDGLDI